MSIFELNAAPVEPLDEIDADLHLAEATLFTIAAREASPAIVTISHPRGLRALQRMTAGEVQSLASSVCASFRIRTSITDVANEIQAQPIEMTIDASLEERVVGPRERILESVLLTHRATVLRSTSPQLAAIKTGLSLDDCDTLSCLTIETLRRIAAHIAALSCESEPIFELRYQPELLIAAGQTPALFHEMSLAQIFSSTATHGVLPNATAG